MYTNRDKGSRLHNIFVAFIKTVSARDYYKQLYWNNKKTGKLIDGKDRQHANMGLPCVFQHRNEKGGLVDDLGQPGIFHLLHSLVAVSGRTGLGCENISNRRLELVRDDGSHYVLVLDKFKVG